MEEIMSEQRLKGLDAVKAALMADATFHMLDQPPLASDLLKGVRNITLFVCGTANKNAVRGMYHVLETSNTIPAFKIGSIWYARKSSIRATFWSHERRAWRTKDQELLVRIHILLGSILTRASECHEGDTDYNKTRELM